MKYILTIILLSLLNFLASEDISRIPDDASRIMLNSYLPEQTETLYPAARTNLVNKLNQITSANGVSGSILNPRFILTAKVDVLGKEVTPTAPPLHAYTLGITFYVGDGLQGNLFNHLYKNIKGVGRSETKAYLQALKNINPRDKSFTEFIDNAKKKIIAYYKTQCKMIVDKANTLADQKKYDAAIYELMSIPAVVSECHKRAMDLSTSIYKMKIEHECQINISKSKQAVSKQDWEKAVSHLDGYTPDMECYQKTRNMLDEITESRCSSFLAKAKSAWASRDAATAASHLAKIPLNSSCGNQAEKLAEEIGSALDAKEKRELQLKMNESLVPDTISISQPEEKRPPRRQEPQSKSFHLAAARELAYEYSELQNENIIYDIKDWW